LSCDWALTLFGDIFLYQFLLEQKTTCLDTTNDDDDDDDSDDDVDDRINDNDDNDDNDDKAWD